MQNEENNSRILVGLWDCPYCDAKGISGLKKHCPNCNHPQDEGTKFYLGEEKIYLEGEEAAQYGKGADWTCAYCGALNRYNAENCASCDAPREASTGDYFENEKKQAAKEAKRQAEIDAVSGNTPAPAPKKRKWILFAILAALIIGAIVFIFAPRKYSVSVTAKEWTRVLYTENYEEVERSGWSLPEDATLISSRQEVHHNDSVLDHYEDVQVRRSRSVIDHYDTETYTVNNGDGTFSERSRSVPVYGTEYYYETERQPVYRQVPVYATKYYYKHMEWVYGNPVVAKGTVETPYWPEYTETSVNRVSTRVSSYKLTFSDEKGKSYSSVPVTEDIFSSVATGDSLTITVSAGTVTSINGIQIN